MKVWIILTVVVLVIIAYVVWCRHRRQESFIVDDLPVSCNTLQTVDMGDHSTVVRIQHGNSGKTVILLHNVPLDSSIWNPVFSTVQRIGLSGTLTPTLIAYDLRGFGSAFMSVNPSYNDANIDNHAWTFEEYVADFKKIYDTFVGSGKIKLVGFGLGGNVCQKAALAYPDIVDKLVLLQVTIEPENGLIDRINFLAGPNGWIARNPTVSYLTFPESVVNSILCSWFYLPTNPVCTSAEGPSVYKMPVALATVQAPVVSVKEDCTDPESKCSTQLDVDDAKIPQFNLAQSLWRKGNCVSALQAYKLIASDSLADDWEDAGNLNFMVHILAAKSDPLSSPNQMTKTFTKIQNSHRNLLVVFDIVQGKRGFSLNHPEYIANIICDNCKKISPLAVNPSTVRTFY